MSTWMLTVLLASVWLCIVQCSINCIVDDDQTNPNLDTCLEMGQHFAEKYEKALRKGKNFNQCQEYRDFGDCLRPMLQQCPLLNTTLPHKWKTLLWTMDQACCAGKVCPIKLDCIHKQYNSIYAKLCRELYEFNIVQDTHGKCRFIREKLDCEESLIASSCGEPAGGLYRSLMKASIKKEKCFVPRMHHQTKQFQFSNRCPVNLTDSIAVCAKYHPSDTILHFFEDNDLIADARRKQIKNSCSHYEKYNNCVSKLEKECPEGMNKILQYIPAQRAYELKMDYICSEKKRDYLESVYCYQDIMKNKTFNKCNSLWSKLERFLNLDNMTSYIYYCKPEHPATRSVKRELFELKTCYEGVIRTSCGEAGATTMGKLIEEAFQDPHYLRFRYKPDCDLHHPITPVLPVRSTPSTHTIPNIISSHNNKNKHYNIKNSQKERDVTYSDNNSYNSDRTISNSAVTTDSALSRTSLTFYIYVTCTVLYQLLQYEFG